MKYMIVLLLALFSTLSIAQETAPFTPDQEKQIENLIHAALFNDPASPRIGAKHPKLTLVNFTDYNCPYCKQLDPMLEKIVQKYPDVAVIIKPLPFKGESSVLAARIALTTWREHPQQFLALHEKLMQKRGYHTDDSIKQAQQKAGATPVCSAPSPPRNFSLPALSPAVIFLFIIRKKWALWTLPSIR